MGLEKVCGHTFPTGYCDFGYSASTCLSIGISGLVSPCMQTRPVGRLPEFNPVRHCQSRDGVEGIQSGSNEEPREDWVGVNDPDGNEVMTKS